MAPESKRAQAEALLQALNARDFDTLAGMLDPEGSFASLLSVSEGEEYEGVEGLRRWGENVDDIWDGFRLELVDFVEAGEDQAVAVVRVTGTAKVSEVPLDSTFGQVWTWREGKPSRNVAYAHPHEAFEAVGLPH